MPITLSPLRYPGGKNSTYNFVNDLVQCNNISTYIEPFAGGAGVAFRLLVSGNVKRIIINDYDRSIYSFWYCVLHKTNEFIDQIINTEITIEEWYRQKQVQQNKNTANLFDLGFSTLFLNRTNRSGIIKAGVLGGKEQNGKYTLDCRFNKEDIIRKIETIAALKTHITITNKDAVKFVKEDITKTRKSLTFFDPPYYNKGPDLYTNFYTEEDHIQLSKTINKIMRNRYWILTYDVSEEIKKLYSNYDGIKYYLNYSIAKPSKGQELMFFSKKIRRNSDSQDLLKII